jgi:DNA gyrase subunit A
VIRLDKGEKVVGVDRIDGLGDEEGDDEDADLVDETNLDADVETDADVAQGEEE